MQGVGAPLRRSINPSAASDVAPVPGIVQAMLIGCYPGSSYQRVRGRRTSLPAGKGARGLTELRPGGLRGFPEKVGLALVEPLSHGPSRLLSRFSLSSRVHYRFHPPTRNSVLILPWPRTAGLVADGRARSPGAVIEVACCFSRGEEIVSEHRWLFEARRLCQSRGGCLL